MMTKKCHQSVTKRYRSEFWDNDGGRHAEKDEGLCQF